MAVTEGAIAAAAAASAAAVVAPRYNATGRPVASAAATEATVREAAERGGGGAGLGGAIFVQQGGTLTLAGPLDLSGNTIGGGAGGTGGTNGKPGQAYGSGIFLQGNGSFAVAPGAGQTQTISDAIADQTGVAGSGGSWSLVKNGAGTTVLTGTNAYSGGTTVNAGILQGNAAGLQGNIANKASVVFDQTATAPMPARCPALAVLPKLAPAPSC